ncbi:MAG: S8 family serine peptidase [Chloroflexi bacterium]|nr:S8 family serine peptidase [Chloroflexota bacterium]
MKNLYRLLVSFVAISLLLGLMVPVTVAASSQGPAVASGEYLIGYRSNSRLGAQLRELAQNVAPVMRTSGLTVARISLAADEASATLARIGNDSDVVFIEPNGMVEGTWTPNDPYYGDPTKVYAPQQIKANLAWDLVRGSSSVMVAVVDSGADLAHPDLTGIFYTNPREVASNGLDDDGNGYVDDASGWNFVNGTNLPQDDLGHGTHVSGIVAAQTNNSVGIAGIAGGVKVLPVKVLDSNNQGSWANVASGVIYATDMGARVINLSLGGLTPSATIEAAVQYAQSHGVLVVAAVGNGATNELFYPAAYTGVLGVAATTNTNVRWSLSNYGSYVDVAAPGSTVYSTYWKAGASTYQFMNGTSMAAPAVTGVAALVLSKNPALTADAVATILTSTAQDLGDPGWDGYYGNGQVDAYAAVLAAEATLPANGSIGGQVWVDQNFDGQHQLNETMGISGATVQLHDLRTQAITQAETDSQGNYAFSGLRNGSYQVTVARPQGYVATTSETISTTLGSAQSLAADFGYVAPTAVAVEGLAVAQQGGRLVFSWQAVRSSVAPQWHVLRAVGQGGQPKRITPQPVSGTQQGADSWTYRFEDDSVTVGQTYRYWLENAETGETFGPVQGTVANAPANLVFVPFVTR